MRSIEDNAGAVSLATYLSWIVAFVATVGSLFFSEVMELPPCVLCWYQRIAMYPLVLVIGVGIVLRDPRVKFYGVPLAIVGLLIAVYHNLLYYGVIPESITPLYAGHILHNQADRMAWVYHDPAARTYRIYFDNGRAVWRGL